MNDTALLERARRAHPSSGKWAQDPSHSVRIELGPGVTELVRQLGEQAITVEMSLDFESCVMKRAVAFPGPSEASLGFQRQHLNGLDIWWRQRLVLATGLPKVTTVLRPRRIMVGRTGRALSAAVDYA